MVGGALAVNTVIDEERRLSFVNFGEIVSSHLETVDYTREYSEIRLPRKFKTVLTSAAGYPLDRTYYQTVKGMAVPVEIVAPGGDLIIASDCSEGMGSDAYVDAQRRYVKNGLEGFMSRDRAEDARRHRRMADRDAGPHPACRQRDALHRGAAGRRSGPDRRRHHRVGGIRACGPASSATATPTSRS